MPITPASEVEGKKCEICGGGATHIYGDMYVCCQCHQKTSVRDVIYLQVLNGCGEPSHEITWCEDRIYKTDIEYIRKEVVND